MKEEALPKRGSSHVVSRIIAWHGRQRGASARLGITGNGASNFSFGIVVRMECHGGGQKTGHEQLTGRRRFLSRHLDAISLTQNDQSMGIERKPIRGSR